MTRYYLVDGMVQGVGFRWFTLRSAERLRLRGWVRNLPDGRVEVVAAGTVEALERFEQEIRMGPSGASVTNVQRKEIPDEHDVSISFEIR